LAPSRLRIGIGVARQEVAGTFGAEWASPLQHLREFVFIVRTLLRTGEVNFAGKYFAGRAQVPTTLDVPVLVGALRSGPYGVAGEVADGVISSLATWSYIESECLASLRESAAAAVRELPPVVLNVLACPTTDVELRLSLMTCDWS
jgi:alkanesulfonate monooxygenase SsuD/methylene tetrahydromethanopterin reductase-like flavin-dependent oxidoreductase (luciferase family)